jgi:hypothetical protein
MLIGGLRLFSFLPELNFITPIFVLDRAEVKGQFLEFFIKMRAESKKNSAYRF